MAIFHKQLGIHSPKRKGAFVLSEMSRQINDFLWLSKKCYKLIVVYVGKSLSVPHARWTDLSRHETEQRNNLGIIPQKKSLKNFVEGFLFPCSFLVFKKYQHTKKVR